MTEWSNRLYLHAMRIAATASSDGCTDDLLALAEGDCAAIQEARDLARVHAAVAGIDRALITQVISILSDAERTVQLGTGATTA